MRFGPTSLNLPSVLAKGLHRPKLRSDLRISEQHVAGETSFIIKIVDTSSVQPLRRVRVRTSHLI